MNIVQFFIYFSVKNNTENLKIFIFNVKFIEEFSAQMGNVIYITKLVNCAEDKLNNTDYSERVN